MWRGEPSRGADAAGVSPVAVRMWRRRLKHTSEDQRLDRSEAVGLGRGLERRRRRERVGGARRCRGILLGRLGAPNRNLCSHSSRRLRETAHACVYVCVRACVPQSRKTRRALLSIALHRDWAHPCHICRDWAHTGSPLPHPHRAPSHFTGTGHDTPAAPRLVVLGHFALRRSARCDAAHELECVHAERLHASA